MNIIKCKLCGDILHSKYRHDYRSCSCNAVSTDGGDDYQNMNGSPEHIEIFDSRTWEWVDFATGKRRKASAQMYGWHSNIYDGPPKISGWYLCAFQKKVRTLFYRSLEGKFYTSDVTFSRKTVRKTVYKWCNLPNQPKKDK